MDNRFRIHLLHKKITYLYAFLFAICLCLLTQTIWAHKTFADTYTNGHLIDNALFLNAHAMNADDIQTFLSSKSGTLKSSSFLMDCDVAGSTAKQMYLSIGAPCGQTISVARIIYYASQIYGINPEVVLATLQKEQSLVTDPAPTARAYAQAMGYDCPDSGVCSSNSDFFYQIDNGTWVLRYHYERANGNGTWWNTSAWACGTTKNYYSPNLYPKQNVNFYDDNGTLYATVYIANAATSSLYCYTPHAYNNPQGLNGLPAFGTTGSYYSGSYNFVKYYELWFGSTYAFIHNGIDYSSVFDPEYYLNNNSDLRAAFGDDQLAAFNHFINYGMNEGRQASANFNVTTYRNRYPDLRWVFGNNLPAYYMHYITNGQYEGRSATGTAVLQPVTSFGGVNYSSIYDFSTYIADNPDLQSLYNNNDTGALLHFINYGMSEGRQASSGFNVFAYQARYYDLRRAFGNNLKAYYLHYITNGKAEGRIATGSYIGGTTVLNGIDYSAVYNLNDYETANPDIKSAFGLNDIAALQHFVNYGMSEGRQASSGFNVFVYKARYPDLQAAFGNNLKAYYMHYITNGKAEGRSGT